MNAAPPQKRRTPKAPRTSRWLRPGDLPVSISFLRALINAGLVESYTLTIPGSKRQVRFIDADSFDRWVRSGKEGFGN
jgi:hypothetical protein